MKKSIQHKAKKWVIGILLSPFVLFLLLAVLLYLPPVQNFVVHRVAASLSESTGMNISVSRVRLSFPLDLSVKGVEVIDGRDTIVSASSLYLDVRLKPLFEGRADIDGFSSMMPKLIRSILYQIPTFVEKSDVFRPLHTAWSGHAAW